MKSVTLHQERVARLAAALERQRFESGPEHRCPYLPDRLARHVAFALGPARPGLYQALMDLNFRRSGHCFYRPQCVDCSECRALRVPVATFEPNRAQRRAWARNADLSVQVSLPEASDEKHGLYARYLAARHDGAMDGSAEEFQQFLYVSAVDTLEVSYRHQGRLLGVAIVDVEPGAMSAVYCYFDPAEADRSLGVYNILWLIETCRQRALPYLYLGYWVAGSRKMAYKAHYRPHEVLMLPGGWVSGEGGRDVGE